MQKPNGGQRFILNLKSLNKFIKTKHFKLEDYRTASKLITKDCFMGAIDLKDAYFFIPIKKCHRKFLRFQYADVLYEFNCLPFGLCTAPYVFTKLLKPVCEYLRSHSHTSVIYLDDIFCIGRSFSECNNNIATTKELLETLGFIVNKEKSCLLPTKECKYLGFIFDSKHMIMRLPDSKKLKVKQLLINFLNTNTCKLRQFARFIGLLISVSPAITYSWLYTKDFERYKYLCLLKNPSYDRVIEIPAYLKKDMYWWLEHIDNNFKSLYTYSYDLEIYTDASMTGWGAYCNNNKCFGYWKIEERNLHINLLELKAAFFALKCFTRNLKNLKVLLRIDNVTAISCINKMGSVQYSHLNKITKDIWQWCERRNIFIFASYINTKDNFEADQLSRKKFEDTEWELNDKSFSEIINNFGIPDIDLFASRHNTKCFIYVTWKNDPDAWAIDAFTISWSDIFFYAFPPFSLIVRLMQKIITDKAEGIVVVPYWPTQPWFPIFNKLLASKPLYFHPDINLLKSPFRTSHSLYKTLTLVAAKLSGRYY